MRLGFSVLAAAAVLAGGCTTGPDVAGESPDGGSSQTGRVRIVLGGGTAAATAPAPDPGIESAAARFSSVHARNLDGDLVGLGMNLPVTVDLIRLTEGGTVELPMGSLPEGSYDRFVVVIQSLHVEVADGSELDVTPPAGGWTANVPTEPFDVVEGHVTTAHLSFRADGAFRWVHGHDELEFHPEFDCDDVF